MFSEMIQIDFNWNLTQHHYRISTCEVSAISIIRGNIEIAICNMLEFLHPKNFTDSSKLNVRIVSKLVSKLYYT